MTGSHEGLLAQQIQMKFGDLLFVFLGCDVTNAGKLVCFIILLDPSIIY